ncbi:unnamed protein product [Rhizophagus irregularis]|nr:unnamed protein product [Rhizophagus irregularis]
MGRQPHFLTPYVVVLHAAKKANKSNKYAVCRACISIIGKDEAYKLKFTNTKKECARHIKNCPNFAQKYSSQQIAKLLDDAAKDGAKSKPFKKRCRTESSDDDDNDNPILEEETSNLDEITLDNYIFCPLTIIQEQKLEQLLLDNLATKIEEQESDDLYDFPNEYLNCISDNNWWKKLKELETLVLPYCAALNQLQRHNSQLHDVLHCFGNLVIVLHSLDNNNLKNKLLKKLEKRWSDWEQPLLLLAFLLHPGYRIDKFNPEIETLSFSHLVELEAYRQKKYPYNDATSRQFNNNVLEFWNYVRGYSKELYCVAERIFSIAVTTASLERLFFTMGWLHSKRRNRLAHEKVLGMTHTGVALPVNENEDPNASDDLNVSDDESSSEFIETDANVQTESNWRSVVSRWINMLEDESNEEYDNNNESDSNDDDEELEINVTNISNLPHPARDQNSKWKLQDIFIESLGEPNYLSAFILGNN